MSALREAAQAVVDRFQTTPLGGIVFNPSTTACADALDALRAALAAPREAAPLDAERIRRKLDAWSSPPEFISGEYEAGWIDAHKAAMVAFDAALDEGGER